ncbi:hypothetical protein [Legionella sp. km772]|uniref:hypothetical protein n=1 Tax=Legionella sp. km772 TaxID=2498111 RepID=UPI000F8D5353|nr:hypothetical protein [Legionella sp. km772]RUR08847.1 hypothetical protein ELY15_10035 [Legionella sp. km772]
MPLDKEKARELERLLDQVLETQFALRHKANARALPGQLREDISAVCDACQEHFSATAQKIRTGTAAESDMATLKTVHDNLTKANFLVDSVNLTLKAKENDSSFVAKLVSETKRIGNTLGEMIKDDSRSLGDKLFTGMKALVVSCLDAAVGAAKGIRQGYVENEGLVNTLGGIVKGGAKGALLGAASGAADAFMKDEDRARKQISDLRQSNASELLVLYDKVKDEQAPGFAANKARIEVLKEEQNYLSELDNKLNNNPDQKTTKETIGSLRVLSLTSAGSALMHTALETMHDFSSAQKFGGLEGPKALEKLGKEVVSATKNFNAVLDDASTSLPSKLFTHVTHINL